MMRRTLGGGGLVLVGSCVPTVPAVVSPLCIGLEVGRGDQVGEGGREEGDGDGGDEARGEPGTAGSEEGTGSGPHGTHAPVGERGLVQLVQPLPHLRRQLVRDLEGKEIHSKNFGTVFFIEMNFPFPRPSLLPTPPVRRWGGVS